MINKTLQIVRGAAGRPARLRADRIRRDTLTMLAAAWAEDHDNSVRDAVDALIDAMKHDAPDVEIDALVDDITDLADMGRAVMTLTPADVHQLADQAADALPTAGTVTALPVHQDRRAS